MAYQRRNQFKKTWERGSDGRPGGKSFMFDAVCAQCSSRCQVPFKPNGRKPVLCSNCFGKGGDRGDRFSGRSERPSFDRPSFQSRGSNDGDRLKAIEAKLDQILEILDEALVDEAE
jgi:CxxC-x17-CxxC domain-containing protein